MSGGNSEDVLMCATAIDGVTIEMNLYRDESFGPLVGSSGKLQRHGSRGADQTSLI